MNSPRLLHITAELSPFRGDSDRSNESRLLCRGLAGLGLEVTVIAPVKADVDGLARRLSPLALPSGEVTIYEGGLPGGRVEVLAIQTPSGEADSQLFCEAAVALATQRGAQPDVILASNGAEKALAALVAAFPGSADEPGPLAIFALRGFEPSDELVAAMGMCDRIVVSSSSWAQSLRSDPESDPRGQLLAPVIDRVRGVTSGVDSVEWDPARDPYVPGNFAVDPLGYKARHKEELQRDLGLRVSPDAPLIALVGPLDPVILPYAACNEICQRELQLVVMADRQRDSKCLAGLSRLANQSSQRIAVHYLSGTEDDRKLEHRLMAAADFALFARRFSPTALSELYCTRYGTAPIAPRHGSFADTLVEFDGITNTGSGFLFAPSHGEQIVSAVERALRVRRKPEIRAALIERVAALDLSWSAPAQRYANLFLEVLREKGRVAA